MGVCYFEMNEVDKSIQILEKAMKLDEKDVLALNTLGACYCWKGKRDKGLSLLDTCLLINPNYAEAYQNKGL